MLKLSEFFEVPEGVEFKIINSLEPIYKIINNRVLYKSSNDLFISTKADINWFIGKEIKIIPPKKTISGDEKVILRNLPSEFTWIARDSKKERNTLFVYASEPYRQKSYANWHCNGECEELNLFEHLFQCIKWEDEEATLIADLLKEV